MRCISTGGPVATANALVERLHSVAVVVDAIPKLDNQLSAGSR